MDLDAIIPLQKHTIDGLRADLARVTAERDCITSERREYWRERLIADGVLVSSEQLRTRVAELELDRQALFERSVKLGDRAAELVANLAKASKRNAELVEQLKAYGKYAHDTTLEDQNAELVAALQDACAMSAGTLTTSQVLDLIASAESAAPGLRTDNPMAEPVMGGLPRYDGEKLGTPAKQQSAS